LLSLIIFIQSCSYVFIYIERLANIKHEVYVRINSRQRISHTRKFVFSKEEYYHTLNWKDEKEFELSGMMYDIVSVEIKDSVTVTCLRDQKEEKLISNYEKLFNRNCTKDKIGSGLRTFLHTLNLLAIPNEILSVQRITVLMALAENYFNSYQYDYANLESPPPRFSLNSF
jgi:hypothetical protein